MLPTSFSHFPSQSIQPGVRLSVWFYFQTGSSSQGFDLTISLWEQCPSPCEILVYFSFSTPTGSRLKIIICKSCFWMLTTPHLTVNHVRHYQCLRSFPLVLRGSQHATPMLFLFLAFLVTAWGNEPLFLFFSWFLPLPLFACLFTFLFCFVYDTASWDWSGWHPRSHSGQCTFHLHFLFLLYFLTMLLLSSIVPPLSLPSFLSVFHLSSSFLLLSCVMFLYPCSLFFGRSVSCPLSFLV